MPNIVWKDRKRTLFGLPWSFTKYSLSDDRLFISTGFLSTKEDEVRLYRIMDISLNRTLGQRIFGLGTIKCCSADKTLGDFEIKNIKKSKDVKELLSEMVENERNRKKVTSREFIDHEDSEFDDGHDDM
ncbi:PH domain-containing protein [Coprococcus eutactus]|uniref:PH domain-containing protein n=1 Tax=Coprococcus eutactus TaxID=33043 RepID=A0A3R5WRG8_9FIRM|nr:PH domain-containing protein [Coprococcus eutactus]